MKKNLISVIILFTFILSYINVYAENENITVLVDGEKINFDSEPIIIDGRTLVPVRAVFEALGADVKWDGETNSIFASKNSTTIYLTIGSTYYFKNSSVLSTDVAPHIINDRTYVPVRVVAESFNCNVSWDDVTKTVIISQPDKLSNYSLNFSLLKDWIIKNHTHYLDNSYNVLYINENKRTNISYDADKNTVSFDYYIEDSNNSSSLCTIELYPDNPVFFYIASTNMGNTEVYSGHGVLPVDKFIVGETDSVNQIIDNTYSNDEEVISTLNNLSASLINLSLFSAQVTLILKQSPVSLSDLGFIINS